MYQQLPESLPHTPKSCFWTGRMPLLSLLVQSHFLSLFPPSPLLDSLDLAFNKGLEESMVPCYHATLIFQSLKQTNKNFTKRFANELAIEKQMGMIESGFIHISQQFLKVKHLISEELCISCNPCKIPSWP